MAKFFDGSVRWYPKTTGIQKMLKTDGAQELVSDVADGIAEEVGMAAGLFIVREPFPEEGGGDLPGAVRRHDEMAKDRAHAYITVTHPNRARRKEGRELLQASAAFWSDIDFDGKDTYRKGAP